MEVKVVYAPSSQDAIERFRDMVRRMAGGEAAPGDEAIPPPRPMRQPQRKEEPRQP